MISDADRAQVDRVIVDRVVPELYEVMNALLRGASKSDLVRARRLLPASYSESFAAKVKPS